MRKYYETINKITMLFSQASIYFRLSLIRKQYFGQVFACVYASDAIKRHLFIGPVAQLDRVPDYESGG